MIRLTTIKGLAIATGAALLFAGSTMAGDECLVIDDKCPVVCKEDPGFCKIFDYSTLYKNENNCLIQKVQLTGRYQGQQHSTSLNFSNPAVGAPNDAGASFWEHRRFRLGTKIQFLNDFTFYNEWNIADIDALTRRSFFNNIDVMGIKWEPNDDFYVNVGKDKAYITREYSTSSKKILTFERSFITNEVIAAAGKMWGARVGFKALGIQHELGAYLAGADIRSPLVNQRTGPLWPDFDTRGVASYRAEYGLNDNTDLHFDYLFTNNSKGTQNPRGNADVNLSSNYNHVLAFGTDSSWDLGVCDRKVGLVTDLIVGLDRRTQGGSIYLPNPANNRIAAGEDTFGVVVMPHIDLTERLQLVSRYAYASTTRMHRPQRAVHTESVQAFLLGRANLEDAHTFYVGVNYRLCGDKLKLMAGYEYLTADVLGAGNGDVSGDSWMFGVRTYW